MIYKASMIEPLARNSNPADIDRLIGEVYGSLSPQLKQAARYLTEHPDNIAVHSMRAVARDAEVQPSTMTRLARALNYEGYEALRDEFRSRVVGEGGFARRASQLQSDQANNSVQEGYLGRQIRASIDNIEASASSIPEATLERIALLLLSCDRVMVTGMLSSFPLASYTHYMASMALPHWSLLRMQGDSFADRLTDLTPGDGLLAIAFPPYARMSIEAAFHAKQRGCKVVAVTDSPLSPIAPAADELLACRTTVQHFFPSGAAVVTVLEALVGALIATAGDTAVQRLSEVERTRRGFGEYWGEEI